MITFYVCATANILFFFIQKKYIYIYTHTHKHTLYTYLIYIYVYTHTLYTKKNILKYLNELQHNISLILVLSND